MPNEVYKRDLSKTNASTSVSPYNISGHRGLLLYYVTSRNSFDFLKLKIVLSQSSPYERHPEQHADVNQLISTDIDLSFHRIDVFNSEVLIQKKTISENIKTFFLFFFWSLRPTNDRLLSHNFISTVVPLRDLGFSRW